MDKSSQEIATVPATDATRKGVQTPALTERAGRKSLSPTQRITYIATLVAASLVLKTVGGFIKTDAFSLSFAYIPWFLSAILMGPIGGAVVAGITDVLGAFLQGYSTINPVLTLSCMAMGAIMGICFRIPRFPAWASLLLGTVIILPVCTIGLGALGLSLYYPHSFTYYVLYRLPQTLVVTLNAVLTAFLFPLLRKCKWM